MPGLREPMVMVGNEAALTMDWAAMITVGRAQERVVTTLPEPSWRASGLSGSSWLASPPNTLSSASTPPFSERRSLPVASVSGYRRDRRPFAQIRKAPSDCCEFRVQLCNPGRCPCLAYTLKLIDYCLKAVDSARLKVASRAACEGASCQPQCSWCPGPPSERRESDRSIGPAES
jgi:hypothetical protein